MKNYYSNIFLIAGSGRNVGKTTFCCKLINKFAKENRIIAIKITDHFHDLKDQSLKYYYNTENYIIAEELDSTGEKDTSRYLKSGADSSFLIISKRETLPEALKKLDLLIDFEINPIILESGSFMDFIKPEISGFVTNNSKITLNKGYDFVVHFIENEFDITMDEFSLHGNSWEFH